MPVFASHFTARVSPVATVMLMMMMENKRKWTHERGRSSRGYCPIILCIIPQSYHFLKHSCWSFGITQPPIVWLMILTEKGMPQVSCLGTVFASQQSPHPSTQKVCKALGPAAGEGKLCRLKASVTAFGAQLAVFPYQPLIQARAASKFPHSKEA